MRIKDWNIDIESIIEDIKKKGYKKVCIQLPDGLKKYSSELCDLIEREGLECYIYFGSNYGACDLPLFLKDLGIEVLINIGHAKWKSLELTKQEEEQ